MAHSVQMPALGESVTEGTITRWLKQEGDTVEVDEPLLEVSTDKVDTEIPSPAAGVLKKIVAQEDDTVEVGGELAVIGDADEDTGDSDDSDDAGGEQDSGDDEPADTSEDDSGDDSRDDSGDDSGEDDDSADQEPEPQPAQKSSGGSGDATSVKMPELGESVTEGTVTRWLKKVGDSVEVDEPLLEVSTDKVDTEIPSPVAGTLLEIIAEEDDTVEVGGELAKIGDGQAGEEQDSDPEPEPESKQGKEPEPEPEPEQEPEPEPEPKQEKEPEPEKKPEPKPEAEDKAEQPGDTAEQKPEPREPRSDDGSTGPYVTPLVRKLAAEHGIDLSTVKGTGIGGRIRKQDVLAAAEQKQRPTDERQGGTSDTEQAAEAPDKAPAAAMAPANANTADAPLSHLRGTTQKANRIRQLTAKKTRESLQATAQLTQTHEVDMTRIVALRARAKNDFAEREGVNLTFLPFIARAVIDALKAHPNVNASYNEDTKEITYYDAEHLGIAVDTEQGLLSPVIHNAGDLSLAGLARAISDIANRARSGDLKPDELSGGTFTITNIGSQGALFDTPILVPPQAAMLGTGAIVKRPRVIVDELGNESIGVRSICYLPLTYDHRLIDGADAGRFLTTIKRRLEEGAFETDLGL
ncbi:2-oxoglutarate dehydrogenase, E2 component, dihydrolipoamide succinyltransferase [Mycobacterium sp. MYCO198283]|uniref:2-oxoglutarate dehydrogenase, E2 component, dihydrolipoamide succinyltransferase n=1 Tax=Mycobacterium sp. MYCO198283 TaxID=2883505 RepID=UPI001E57CFCB|nr:2-oxoglutarate dehydrogenase, E2 component, dihydrolipoamide succinyltransferase [Mycobacterium sp. MYCO198283]MCG5432677.1 2-oxoglutarate dehydrogenase, E2 component, dihydrolipoamide succinyltransferase [Mycobacterium sp. MYCO198283]